MKVHNACICSLAWSHNGRYILWGSWDNTVSVWENEGTCYKPLLHLNTNKLDTFPQPGIEPDVLAALRGLSCPRDEIQSGNYLVSFMKDNVFIHLLDGSRKTGDPVACYVRLQTFGALLA